MDARALERELLAAGSNEQWVAVLARAFDAHGLVFGHGTDNAADEAYWLLRHLQGYDDARFAAAPDPALAPQAAALASARIERRVPLAHLLGEAWFAGLPFTVDARVLVPRSPLAEVIEAGFRPWCDVRAGDRLLDVGTGSGCIAIAAAHYCPGTLVDATDTSPGALEVAAANVERHGLGGRVRLVEAALFPPGDARYRVIISNPPYVPDAELEALPPEYAAEPRGAFAGGPDGLDLVRQIVRGARGRLVPGGILLVEIGGGMQAFERAFPRLPVTWVELERGGDGVFVIAAEELAAV